MTRSKSLKVVLLSTTVSNLQGTRKMFKAMGKPLSTIRKIDDAISAITQVIESLESK